MRSGAGRTAELGRAEQTTNRIVACIVCASYRALRECSEFDKECSNNVPFVIFNTLPCTVVRMYGVELLFGILII